MKTLAEKEAAFWQKEAAKAAAHAMEFAPQRGKKDMAKYMQEIARLNAAKAMRYLDEALGVVTKGKDK